VLVGKARIPLRDGAFRSEWFRDGHEMTLLQADALRVLTCRARN
jgi:hypothetical protein